MQFYRRLSKLAQDDFPSFASSVFRRCFRLAARVALGPGSSKGSGYALES